MSLCFNSYCVCFIASVCAILVQIQGDSFINTYFYVLRGQANESFGYSLTPVSAGQTVRLIVGAPRTGNSLPTAGSLGGFYSCDLKTDNCGPNLITGLGSHVWDISNLGFYVTSTYDNGVGTDESLLVCDPRARVKKIESSDDASSAKFSGVGLCYAFRPGQYTTYGAIAFYPDLTEAAKTPVVPMLFGHSAVPLPGASAYAFGMPYLLSGFGGTFYSSEFSADKLDRSSEPLVMWGHSFTGGFESPYADLKYSSSEEFARFFLPKQITYVNQMQNGVLAKSVPNYGCSGFAVATGRRLAGPASSGVFDLAEGSPCIPDLAGLRANSFSTVFIAEYVAASARWRGVGNGAVRLYRVFPKPNASPLCGRRAPSDLDDTSVNCFNESSLRATLTGPAFGSRFGHALLAVDLNADGWEDLVVSAPWARGGGGGAGTPASHRLHGAVFVYINKGGLGGKYISDPPDHRLEFPPCSEAPAGSPVATICAAATANELWLGWSLAALGDVDLDGYADFDASGYPDLMVGAPRHGPGAVFFYPARYVIRLAVGAGQAQPQQLDRETPPVNVAVRVWLNFTQQRESLFSTEADKPSFTVQIQFFIDTLSKRESRFGALNLEANNTLLVTARSLPMFILKLEYKGGNDAESDTDTPLVVEAVWRNLSPTPRSEGSQPVEARRVLLGSPLIRGVGSDEGRRFRLSQINWVHDCSDTECGTQLTIDCESNITRRSDTGEREILVDEKTKTVEVRCRVSAAGEDAFGTYMVVTYSKAFSMTSSLREAKFQPAEFKSSPSNTTVSLLVGNPLPPGSKTDVVLHFKPVDVRPDTARANFNFHLVTRSRLLEAGSRTQASVSAAVRLMVSVELQSSFSESLVYTAQRPIGFNAFEGQAFKLSRKFPRLSVTVSSRAGTHLPHSYLVMHWPLETLPEAGEANGKYLMYWQTQPYVIATKRGGNFTSPDVTCDSAQVASVFNPLRLNPDNIDKFPETLPLPADSVRRLVRLQEGVGNVPIPEPLTEFVGGNRSEEGGFANPRPECTRKHRFNFTFTCANSRCLPVVCRIGGLSAKMGPLEMRFITVAYKYTFIEDHVMCTSVKLVPSVQWMPSPEYAGRIVSRRAGSLSGEGLPVLQAFNYDKPPPEEINVVTKVLIYGGGALLGAAILGLIILLLALCTPFFKRKLRAHRDRDQQAAVAATAAATADAHGDVGDYEDAGVGLYGGASAGAAGTRLLLNPQPPPMSARSNRGSSGQPHSIGRQYRFEEEEVFR